jgi:hypothetical protein
VSTPDPRDRALEHLLRRQTPAASADTPACANPEVLAAWLEGGLDAPVMAETELHLSTCVRCQAMLAALVRSEPEAPAVEPWWPGVHLRWLVPLTAAAAATVLWMVGPTTRPAQPIAEPETKQARAERGDAADAPVPAPAPRRDATTEPSTPAATPPPAAPASPAPPELTDNEAGKALSAKPERAETSASAQARSGAAAQDRTREAAPADRDALAKQEAAKVASRSNEGRRQTEALEESATVTGATPAAEAPRAVRAVPPPAPPPAPAAGSAGVAGFAASGVAAIPSADGVTRWRLPGPEPGDIAARRSSEGMVDRSDDGGATWQRVPTGIPVRFTAGFAPSATVCWLVGAGGAVAVTNDGRTWRRASRPAPDADLTSVEASDARTATVRDTQGRAFRTTDGGATWTATP